MEAIIKMADEAKVLELLEIARDTGKIRKGANEATKAIEKGDAKLVVYAGDVSPKEIVMHLPLLCKDKNVLCIEVGSKEGLGAAAGLGVGTTAVAVVKEGEAKTGIAALTKESAPKKEAPAEEKPKEELKKEEKPAKEEQVPQTSNKPESKEEKKKEKPAKEEEKKE